MTGSCRAKWRRRITYLLMSVTSTAFAIDTASITSSALSLDCLEYRVVGICFWLRCSIYECQVETSVQVRHYVPDAVVSSYSNTGENPWVEVAAMSRPNTTAVSGGDGSADQANENDMAKFKNADVIGHPAGLVFNRFAAQLGYICPGAGTPLTPYLLSTLDTLAWRYNIPEMFYPESLIPGRREIGSRQSLNLWGNVYPRGGFLHQVDDHKSAAVVAQRAGDIVTRGGQPHVYQPLLPRDIQIVEGQDGYWPAGALIENDARTGKWQPLTPTLSSTCAVFPHRNARAQATDGGYAWALWRPYSCCERRGQIFLGHIEFAN
ncbi:integrating conjugative element protein [Steroidobacter agaridevorans]|uniref:Integrating conjugative element protein n=1 Tax=Steroidobacter agaridevorans TaxID=2695856 RepID=A0A829Y8F2_9GAMM|nr:MULTISPECIES: TIGR03756 family integrating conjugative element protein [Steroidobacteraceae]GFE79148.1 integrating conjugative element protein [Steroidobacter agaridevorans]